MSKKTRELDNDTLSKAFEFFISDSDRSCALLGASILDYYLKKLIIKDKNIPVEKEKIFFNQNNYLFYGFASKIECAELLNIIDEVEYKELDCIKSIRNIFAHDISKNSFSEHSIKDKCKSSFLRVQNYIDHYQILFMDFFLEPRNLFIYTVLSLIDKFQFKLKEIKSQSPEKDIFNFLLSKILIDHFYTIDISEVKSAIENFGYKKKENFSCFVYKEKNEDSIPIFRFWNQDSMDHFYTTNPEEDPEKFGYSKEGAKFFICQNEKNDDDNVIEFIRLWSDKLRDHLYTIDENEKKDAIEKFGYIAEDKYYVFKEKMDENLVPLFQLYKSIIY